MGKNNLQLPAPPTYYQNSNLNPNIDLGSQTAKDLINGNFGGNLSWLSPTINNNNSANALSYAQGTLQPQFRDTLQQISNQAAANGQLNSSTFSDALARSQSDLNSQYQSIVSQQAINDSNQSNANRLNLFGTGLDTLQNFTGLAQGQTNNQNNFNLENYQNLVANAIQNNQNANSANGWQQAIGMLSPIGHDYLQSQGVTSLPGYGVADVAKIAGTFSGLGGGFGNIGGGLQSGQVAPSAGTYASNNPFNGTVGSLANQRYNTNRILQY